MYKEAFLDRAQAIKVKLLKTLFVHEGEIPREQLITLMAVHEKIMKQTVAQLNNDSHRLWKQAIIEYKSTNDTYQVCTCNHNLDELIYYYLENAVNVQIIDLIIRQSQLSKEQITQNLFLSESEYDKRIKRINKLLQGFDVQIEVNTLRGTRSALMSFMYQFYTKLSPQKSLYKRNLSPQARTYFTELASRLNLYWREEIYQTLDLWISLTRYARNDQVITTKQFSEEDTVLSSMLASFSPYFAKTAFSTYVGGSCQEIREFYALFILFCISQGFLPANHSLVQRYMRHAASEKDLFYQGVYLLFKRLGMASELLNKRENQWILYARLLGYAYCKGHFFSWDQETVNYYIIYNHQREEIERNLTEVAKQTPLSRTYLMDNRVLVSHTVYQFVYCQFRSFQKPFKIGVFLSEYYPTLQETYCRYLEHELLKGICVHVQLYQSNQDYDLIISNFQQITFPLRTSVCYITNLGNLREEKRIYDKVKEEITQRRD